MDVRRAGTSFIEVVGARCCKRSLDQSMRRGRGLDTGIRIQQRTETGGVDTPALLNELLQHHLSSLAERWHTQRTGYIIGGDGDTQEMIHWRVEQERLVPHARSLRSMDQRHSIWTRALWSD